jgi:hypothetical protein
MSNLQTTARDLMRTADKLAALCQEYINNAMAEARESGRCDTAGGMSGQQLRKKLQAHVTARLCPKPVFGKPEPPLQFAGAPEARRYAAVTPLPGLPT